jgi:hypothetical protein
MMIMGNDARPWKYWFTTTRSGVDYITFRALDGSGDFKWRLLGRPLGIELDADRSD